MNNQKTIDLVRKMDLNEAKRAYKATFRIDALRQVRHLLEARIVFLGGVIPATIIKNKAA